MTPETNRFFKKVEFDGDSKNALRIRPAGEASPVVIDPLIRFGRPAVVGVATERLWELYDAGESLEEIADSYEMDIGAVKAAVAYEEHFRSLAALAVSTARFFVDENDLALGKALAANQLGVVYPGHPDLPEVPRQTPDDVWLEIVGVRRLVVITHGRRGATDPTRVTARSRVESHVAVSGGSWVTGSGHSRRRNATTLR